MKKWLLSMLVIGAGTMNWQLAYADNISFDPGTREGRALAYAALNESNAAGNAQRLERNLNALLKSSQDARVKSMAEKLIPQLKELQSALH